MKSSSSLLDLLYFDFEKAASLLSQVEGGLPETVSETTESTDTKRNLRTYELLKLFKGEFGSTSSEKTSILESRLLHHDLLLRVEEALGKLRVIADLNTLLPPDTTDADTIHASIGEHSYLRVEGWAAFEDYERLFEITKTFNDLLAFITRCGLGEAEVLAALRDQRVQAEAKPGGRKSREVRSIQVREQELQKLVKKTIDEKKLPEWLFEGVRLWINTYFKGRLNLRIYPFPECRTFEIIANLKRHCFVDDDLGHLMYGYGTYPNRKLTLLGLITSVPAKGHPEFDVKANLEVDEETTDERATFERAFRNVFAHLDGLESFSTFHRYPRIVVHPLAVYRRVGANNAT
jgi:hypothetical protein